MGEFELIRRYFSPLAGQSRAGSLVLGPGDDCAIERVASGHELVFSVDTLVEGVHFPAGYDPEHLGWRSLAVAASDLAAMGAQPVCFTLALTLPEASPEWLDPFSRGLSRASRAFGLELAGGDTTRGPLTLSLQVHGEVPSGAALLRTGAEAGDFLCVSGTLGAAGAALDYLDSVSPSEDERAVLERYHAPVPRLNLGIALRGVASAAIDISDGLLADLGHILEASGVGADLDCQAMPVSSAVTRLKGQAEALRLALEAGDDYELCVAIPPALWKELPEAVRTQLSIVGKVVSESGITGIEGSLVAGGYDHFGSK
ncbi:thiamin-monophosphate kinase [Marinobacter lipolyticus SM19]|uniref:Thiamine-monophosphate kinase n=1 Tax=Marinobacter lipolyticus SM19 TaxID=1318628 RepID=R8AWN1_9GAMM|nr:thiamine-phosphate kinase [Marinobacter lipolyticus]EON90722.1 thiamin-monophosphate kinase [Marinobacter lipolyticus SM19]